MYEQYHPMGTVGIISAFNFPAVLAWNQPWQVCGDVCVWKPSEKMLALPVNILVIKENNLQKESLV
jgi:aldehyde dehydrogenase (NAD+)